MEAVGGWEFKAQSSKVADDLAGLPTLNFEL
jgi:hypothetical protein